MPTYEYVCKSCGEHIEVFQSFKDKPLKKHQQCGGDLQKRFHASGIVFKGSGFYATDSKSSSSTKSTGSESSSKEKSEGSGKEKSDSKPKAEATTSSKSDD